MKCVKATTHVRAHASAPGRAALDLGVDAEAAGREALPELAEVLAAGERLVRGDDRVARVEERRAARLELHAVEHELHDERVAVLRHERLRLPLRVVLARAVEVALGHGPVRERLRREEVVDEAVLLDQALGDDPEDLRPDLTDGVDTPVAGRVESLVDGGVDGLVLWKRTMVRLYYSHHI